MILKCIAVDDEPIALDLISTYIQQTPYLVLVQKCSSAITALKAIHEHPDVQLLFLDIRMADLSGIELARIVEQSASKKNMRIIFTTAYDQYALEGYKVAALDYLLKPFSFIDFSKAAAKALEYFTLFESPQPLASQVPAAEAKVKEYIYLKVEYQLVKVDPDDILYIEGLKDYVKVFLKSEAKPLLTLTSLKALEEKLPATRFLRLHRSYIVALDQVKAVTKSSVLVGATTIHVSEQYREVFAQFVSKWI